MPTNELLLVPTHRAYGMAGVFQQGRYSFWALAQSSSSGEIYCTAVQGNACTHLCS
jgi:hypothetical protein